MEPDPTEVRITRNGPVMWETVRSFVEDLIVQAHLQEHCQMLGARQIAPQMTAHVVSRCLAGDAVRDRVSACLLVPFARGSSVEERQGCSRNSIVGAHENDSKFMRRVATRSLTGHVARHAHAAQSSFGAGR